MSHCILDFIFYPEMIPIDWNLILRSKKRVDNLILCAKISIRNKESTMYIGIDNGETKTAIGLGHAVGKRVRYVSSILIPDTYRIWNSKSLFRHRQYSR